ncbi:Tyrosinase [Dactylella cylindrospora]|nr:Tyrosinase [Dactylella cylindrospora]
MWQTLNPDSYTQNQISILGTRTNQPGAVEGPSSPLTPFRRTSGEFWNSNSVRRHRDFGYTYPELADYGMVPDYLSKRSLSSRIPHAQGLVKDHKYYEWTADIRINKYIAAGPYLINIYIGAPGTDDWTEDPNFVGSYYVFSKNGTCHDCTKDAMITGSVPLTNVLIQCAKNGHITGLVSAGLSQSSMPQTHFV